jgi:hypothetical protein
VSGAALGALCPGTTSSLAGQGPGCWCRWYRWACRQSLLPTAAALGCRVAGRAGLEGGCSDLSGVQQGAGHARGQGRAWGVVHRCWYRRGDHAAHRCSPWVWWGCMPRTWHPAIPRRHLQRQGAAVDALLPRPAAAEAHVAAGELSSSGAMYLAGLSAAPRVLSVTVFSLQALLFTWGKEVCTGSSGNGITFLGIGGSAISLLAIFS